MDGIGEYWYGAETGEKSSAVVSGGKSIAMRDIVKECQEEVLGGEVFKKFGEQFPLIKILTPKKRLSVQFHDTKDELWIITGIDTKSKGADRYIILGFSKDAIEKYGNNIKEEYKQALEKYGFALNSLIDEMEDRGYKAVLNKKTDVLSAAKSLKNKDEIRQKLSLLKLSKKEMERFYNYRLVKTGDVVPIPSRTLHALGPGIQVVEPQIPGATQSLEDGETYPVRYYFPGYKRQGAIKKLDIERVNEINAEVVKESFSKVIEKGHGYVIERLSGDFRDKGLEVRKIVLKKNTEKEFVSITSFHSLVLIQGRASVVINRRKYEIPKAIAGCEILIIPASSKDYKIVTAENSASIIDTFTLI